ncbi:MAG: hypothetical protein COV44_03515 [Deltaproteobacteria bacterium CG11_big_fil_rev_8_21_14_0_20_45_16]|nr:MAG: hypothetical protein COV44_03515 [Deltaproteobacteria bacterium CG11_big_fil_rev_8_21_14_0_20_45_16]
MSKPNSIQDLIRISTSLKELGIDHAFVGGATVAIYLSSVGITESRPTDDIDCVVDIGTLPDYYKLEDKLRKAGFKNEPKGPRCRWNYQGIVVDIMPADEKISGMPSKWFTEGFQALSFRKLSDGIEIPVFSVAYLLATKFEAYNDRGKENLRFSTDLEDILLLLDGYPDALEDIQKSEPVVKAFLIKQFKSLLKQNEFEEVVHGQMTGSEKKKKADRILERIRSL